MTDTPPSAAPELFLALAESVVDVIRQHGLDALVIGGYALAVHNYVRATEDLDLGVATRVPELRAIRDALEGLVEADPFGNAVVAGRAWVDDDDQSFVVRKYAR